MKLKENKEVSVYIIVDEYGKATKTDQLTPKLLQDEDMGFVDIFNISDPSSPLRLLRGLWSPVEDLNHESLDL